MGFFGMAASGLSFLLVGLWQSSHLLLPQSMAASSRSASPSASSDSSDSSSASPPPLCSSPQSIAIAALSLLHIASGLLASHAAAGSDLATSMASSVPLERSSVALLFFIFAISSLLAHNTRILPLPAETLNMMALCGLGQEFLLFYLQRPDAGLESRYYTLLLVPICGCMVSIAWKLAFPSSDLASLGLALGLLLQGTWMIQMAFSFFLQATMAMGCSLRTRGEGDYVINCSKIHEDSSSHAHGHMSTLMRAKAIATLQFNGHMALLVVVMMSLFALSRRFGRARDDPRRSNDDRGCDAPKYEMVSTADSDDSIPNKGFESPPPSSHSFSLGVDDGEEFNKQGGALQSYQKTNGLHA